MSSIFILSLFLCVSAALREIEIDLSKFLGLPCEYYFIAFTLLWGTSPLHAQLTVNENQEGIMVLEAQQPVLFYQTAPKDEGSRYERTNYIHPLWNVDGTILTEDSPHDHLHQRGVYWTWHQILINGKRIGDGWTLEDFNQKVVSTDWKESKTGTGTLITRVLWSSDLYTRDKKPVPYMLEDTKILIHPKKANYRKIDFIIRLTAMEEPVSIGGSEDEKGYSGFSIRMKMPDDIRFSGPAGSLEPKNTAVESPDYVNISGTFDDNHPGGIVIMDHKSNPDYPQPWILRSTGSMQNVKYPGREPVTIQPEKPLVLRYSLVTYEGKPGQNEIEKVLK